MIRRHYECDVCQHKWMELCAKDDPDPDNCPVCSFAEPQRDEETERAIGEENIRKMVAEGRAPGVLTVKSKAMDYVQSMAEEDYGLTNMNDGGREGEAAFKPEAPAGMAEVNARAHEMVQAAKAAAHIMQPVSPHIASISGTLDPVQTFFGGNGAMQGVSPGPGTPAPANIQAAAPAAAAARADGNDPVAKLHAAGKQGLLGDNYQVVGGVKMPEQAKV